MRLLFILLRRNYCLYYMYKALAIQYKTGYCPAIHNPVINLFKRSYSRGILRQGPYRIVIEPSGFSIALPPLGSIIVLVRTDSEIYSFRIAHET